ncbi:hypothetical protein DSO57_1026805 [Entomophthora muscae]|uniref:Uncharacterized protein n=1 Tax=Entomophthora muscae TaxID=34485 RepID=A0ACC2TCW0_9FUNG|nr:hypothetical protein DSO57_1026805 [Entomophthora muscae]
MSKKMYEEYYGDRMVMLNDFAVYLTSRMQAAESNDWDQSSTMKLLRIALEEDIASGEAKPDFDKCLEELKGGADNDMFKGELKRVLISHHAAAESIFRETHEKLPINCYDGDESWLLKLKSIALEAVECDPGNTITRFSPEIKCLLLDSFSKSAYPSDGEKWRLVNATRTSFQQVSVWFSNQRMRNKNYQESHQLAIKKPNSQ